MVSDHPAEREHRIQYRIHAFHVHCTFPHNEICKLVVNKNVGRKTVINNIQFSFSTCVTVIGVVLRWAVRIPNHSTHTLHSIHTHTHTVFFDLKNKWSFPSEWKSISMKNMEHNAKFELTDGAVFNRFHNLRILLVLLHSFRSGVIWMKEESNDFLWQRQI